MDETIPGPVRGPGRRLAATLAATLAVLSLSVLQPQAGAHPIERWWQYDKSFWRHSPQDHRSLESEHDRWHGQRRTFGRRSHRRFHHHEIVHDHRWSHFNRAREKQSGKASHYDHSTGACGEPLVGLYAAHRTWPCGTRVSVKHGDRYVIVRVLDRGPFVNGWVIDLSRKAFERLAPLGSGVIDVDLFRLARKRR
ncbi:MAG: septal ring lytic transglycosylase RlpA family protein, partial [Actinomycetota bacterium]|nr:septal ring lytic transglycosylase RlpA family protein [Actinomycetota bacterium]